MFKVGDKVKCINNTYLRLLGKDLVVTQIIRHYTRVDNDLNWYHKSDFILASQTVTSPQFPQIGYGDIVQSKMGLFQGSRKVRIYQGFHTKNHGDLFIGMIDDNDPEGMFIAGMLSDLVVVTPLS